MGAKDPRAMTLVGEAGRERDLGDGPRSRAKLLLDVVDAQAADEFAHRVAVVGAKDGRQMGATHADLYGDVVETQSVAILFSKQALAAYDTLRRLGDPPRL